MHELPKLTLVGGAKRIEGVTLWLLALRENIAPGGDDLLEWWDWCEKQANIALAEFQISPISERERIQPRVQLPKNGGS